MEDISKYISVTHRRSQIYYNDHLEKLGITSGQFMYIVCICENSGLTQDELSQKLIIDKSTVTKVLSQLEAKDFILKSINEADRRAFNIFPTENARAIYEDILKIKSDWHSNITEDLSELECDIFERLMKQVMENAIRHCKK